MIKKLNYKLFIEGKIAALTGIHIGSGESELQVEQIASVIKHKLSGEPYLPGSSLKGKMRALYELKNGEFTRSTPGEDTESDEISYTPSQDLSLHKSPRLFGNAIDNKQSESQASRLLVRDAYLTAEAKDLMEGRTDLPYLEVKSENNIDRLLAKAVPRKKERIPAGASFGLSLVLTVYEEEGEEKGSINQSTEENLSTLFESLRLIQDDYIGGGGSRGSGQIAIKISKITLRDDSYYCDGNEELTLWQPGAVAGNTGSYEKLAALLQKLIAQLEAEVAHV